MLGHSRSLGKLTASGRPDPTEELLRSYQRASSAVYDLMRRIEQRRLASEANGDDGHWHDPDLQVLSVCAWNALALQSLGDRFLDAYLRARKRSVGYTPSAIAEQAVAFYSRVEVWLSRARQAESNPDYVPDVSLPAMPPQWLELDYYPREYAWAMLEAMRALRAQLNASLITLEQSRHGPVPARLRQRLAGASATAEYAESLWTDHGPDEIYSAISDYLRRAIDEFFLLGQVASMPYLSDWAVAIPSHAPRPRRARRRRPKRRDASPGQVVPVRYGGLWGRCAAAVLDCMACVLLGSALTAILGFAHLGSLWGFVVLLVLWWLYFTGFESSALQATPGKLALGYRVTDASGRPESFRQATKRFFSKFLTVTLFWLGLFMTLVSSKRQSLHDVIADTVVIDTRAR